MNFDFTEEQVMLFIKNWFHEIPEKGDKLLIELHEKPNLKNIIPHYKYKDQFTTKYY